MFEYMPEDIGSMNHSRRQAFERIAREESSRLGGWYKSGLGDGRDKEGKFVYFHMYKHIDGRSATVWYPGGHCDNADLAEHLRLSDESRLPTKTALLTRIANGLSHLACMLVKGSVMLLLRGSRRAS
jgi:hypothetical protein